MSNLTEWSIVDMIRNTSDGFVTTVHYNITKVDGEISAYAYGTVDFEVGTPTTPYESLTKDQVVGWVKDKLGEEVIEASLASQIAAQKNPVTTAGVPW